MTDKISGEPKVDSQLGCSPRRGSRCGLCYWALYDGTWCQNPDCQHSGLEVDRDPNGGEIIYLSNDEARILIEANATNESERGTKR